MVFSRALAVKPFLGNPAFRQFSSTLAKRGAGGDAHLGKPTGVIPVGSTKFRIAFILSMFVMTGQALPVFSVWYWTVKNNWMAIMKEYLYNRNS